MSKYEIDVFGLSKNKDVIVFRWSAVSIGFGELVIDARTYEIIDDEYMDEEFCKQVMQVGFEKFSDYFK